MEQLAENIRSINTSVTHVTPEVILVLAIVVVLVTGLMTSGKLLLTILSSAFVLASLLTCCQRIEEPIQRPLFDGMLTGDSYGTYIKILLDIATLLTIWMSWTNKKITDRLSEYYIVLIGTLLGAHFLSMSINFISAFISLELISLGSYVLTGYTFDRRGAEGSFKYFVFGSVASAIMLYGFSLLYGLSGTLSFGNADFASVLAGSNGMLMYTSAIMALTGFLYKIAAAPMHPWAPDVYEAAPLPIVAYFSVVPKLAGLAVLIRFSEALPGVNGLPDWQNVLALIAILSITVGNFAALWQQNPKRLMAYSSIAQAGFLLVGVVAVDFDGIRIALFYASVYLAANFLVFVYLQFYESKGIDTLESFSGSGRSSLVQSLFLLVGLIALTGLPPTGGFTSKLFIFSALWEAYNASEKPLLLWLLVFGLLNTVVSLFYYIRIPYFAFIRPGSRNLETKFLSFENLFGLVIVLVVLGLFFKPGMLMGWINKINFAL
ncbi:NADH-quinone oxidoreductase subunit N [Chryseolinea sp. T2]|uniref:NADH-quinone oxidoreductase subunit N n=1 Tax=Chryseolinea sp. T2 TaxID=3129255 RepID=UPI003076C73F